MINNITMANSMIIIFMSLLSISQSEPLGFTTDLIHRDSLHSPALPPSQRLVNAIKRSSYRIQRFSTKLAGTRAGAGGAPVSDIINSKGEYLMRYSIGTPPVESLAIADTGSDIIWTQCQPCIKCFHQNLTLFSPKKSSTYQTIRCNTPTCASFNDTACSPTRKNCLYEEFYGDGSSTAGLLAKETFTLPSTENGRGVPIPNTTFGCGFNNEGVFEGGESGIVGLGGGPTSLVRQMGPLAGGRFSYCLVSGSGHGSSSKLHFGSKAVVSGKGVSSTPLARGESETHYYLTLEGISVGNTTLDHYSPDKEAGPGEVKAGNVIIDSGTTLTLLPFCLYGRLEKELSAAIKVRRVKDPLGILTMCFLTKEEEIEHPPITFHFAGGADLRLETENIFARTSESSFCLAAQPVLFGPGIIGNLAQINFLVGYDLRKRTVSFKPQNCSKR